MQPSPVKPPPALEQKAFMLLLVVVTVAFGWILLPFYGAVFWGAVLAIVFTPVYRKLLARTGRRPTLAALLTLLLIVLLVILPLSMITASLVQEATALYARSRDGGISFAGYAQQIYAALPNWLTQLLSRFGLDNLGVLQQRLTDALNQGSQRIAQQAPRSGRRPPRAAVTEMP